MTTKNHPQTKILLTLDWFSFMIIVVTVFALPLIASARIIDSYELPKYTLLSASALLLASLWLMKVIFRGGIEIRQNALNLLVLGFFSIYLVSTFNSIRFATSLWGDSIRHLGLFTITFYLIILFLVSNYNFGLKRLYVLLLSLIASATVVAAIAALKYAGFSLGTRLFVWPQSFQACSTLGNPNFLAAFLVLTIFATLGTALALRRTALFSGWDKNLSLFCFCSLILQLLGFYLAASRGATVGIIIGLLFFSFLFRSTLFKPKMVFRLFLVLALIFVLLLGLIFMGNLFRFQKLSAAQASSFHLFTRIAQTYDLTAANNIFRLLTWSASLSMIRDHPLVGTGPDTYGLAFPRYHPENFDQYMNREVLIPDRPHNDFLEIASTLGLLGFLFYLSIISASFVSGLKKIKKTKDETLFFTIAGLLAGLAGYISQNFFNFHVMATGFVFWLTIGLIANLTQNQKPKVITIKTWFVVPLQFKTILALGLLVLTLMAINKVGLTPTLAQWHISRAEYLAKISSFELAEAEAKRAIELMPSCELYYLSLGWIYRQWFESDQNLYYHRLAADAYQKAIRTNPLERYTWLTLGAYYLKHFEKYRDVNALYNAIFTFKGLVELEPNYAQSHYNLGVAYFYLKNHPLALEELETTIRLKPTEKDAYLLMGKIYQEKGEKRRAKKYWQKVLELDPGNDKARQALEEIKRQN